MRNERMEQIRMALEKVTDSDMREAIEHFLDGHSFSDTRKAMGISSRKLQELMGEIKKLLEENGITKGK